MNSGRFPRRNVWGKFLLFYPHPVWISCPPENPPGSYRTYQAGWGGCRSESVKLDNSIMCLIFMFVLIMLVQQGKSFTGTGCPRLTMVDCPQGYSVGCCDSKECSNGEFCCLVNSRCEIKCMKPDANGPESPFAEDRDTCMAYAKPPKK
ncbi:hypothetical protein AVEN_59815-1 [Araneus ventricosus]|uniref:Uncharacterized protein n=1 Tax=Araneus ventricosus TaxID=182803 RepID=A0A4Y2UJN6_ARAVE|nr:hypothetical protein AVEN_59815-1 [Araneus ventricosus]